ncbi:MAG: phosphoglycerate dehydrogenase, partial [Eubacteriales bacterium]
MYRIKKFNAISNAIYEYLNEDKYAIGDDQTPFDAALVRSASMHEIEFGSEVLGIARAGAGVNNIPLDKCTDAGIVVFNTPGANANGVKELVLCGMFMASRNIVPAVDWAKGLKGKGDEVLKLVEKGKKQFVGPELKGKTLGVIGLGAIGVMVANAASAIGMDVIGYDPYISVESAWGLSRDVTREHKLEELLAKVDYISLHVPLLDKTRGFLGKEEFARMKKDVVILNFARNGLLNYDCLYKALEDGTVGKYVTDFPNDKLLTYDNVIPIPHLGASTPESEENCARMAAKQLHDFLEYGSIVNSVNLPSCPVSPSADCRLTIIHKNTPGMVGQFTNILGEKGINIDEMVNKSRGNVAYTVFDLDTEIDSDIVKQVNGLEGVIKARLIA